MNDKNREPLKMSTMIAYGFGNFGEGFGYNFFYTFFIFFITSIVGISPIIAGTISFIAVLWDAISDPIVGMMSDRFISKRGRRVPFIFVFSIPMAISVFLLFSRPDISVGALIGYYIVLNIIFWLLYTLCDIPYIALGAEITDDYSERSVMRGWAQVSFGLATIVVYGGTLLIADWLNTFLQSEVRTWGAIGALFGALAAIGFLGSAIMLRKKDVCPPQAENMPKQSIFSAFKRAIPNLTQLLKIKQYRNVLYIAFLGTLILGVGQSTSMFVQTVLCGLDPGQVALIGTACGIGNIVGALILMFFINKRPGRINKREIVLASFIVFVLAYSCIWFLPHGFASALIGLFLVNISYGFFFTVLYPLSYDVAEIDEFKNDTRRDGLIVSLNSFATKVGPAVGMWLVGALLEAFKFDAMAESQTAEALTGLCITSCGLPILICVIALIPTFSYKITNSNFDALKKGLALKRSGQPYDTEGFKELL